MNNILKSSTIVIGLIALGATSALADGNRGGRGGPNMGQQIMSFEQLDTNGDGALTLEELQNRAETKFAESDTNGDGMLDATELAAAAAARQADMIAQMIERRDTDEDGMLSMAEMMPNAGNNGNRDGRLFERADTDGNGEISVEEWEAAKEKLGNRNQRRGHGGGQGGQGHGRRG